MGRSRSGYVQREALLDQSLLAAANCNLKALTVTVSFEECLRGRRLRSGRLDARSNWDDWRVSEARNARYN